MNHRTVSCLFSLGVLPILLLLGYTSCRKVSNYQAPIITLLSPAQGAIYQVNDTIHLSFILQDDNSISTLSISLSATDGYTATVPLVFDNPEKGDTLAVEYVIEDSNLESGPYDIHLQAFDGTNITNHFTRIQVIALPLEFRYPVLITQPGSNQVAAFALRDSSNWESLIYLQGDYSGSALYSARQLLYIAGRSQTDVSAFNLLKKEIVWSLPAKQNAQNRWFEAISFSGSLLYVSYYDGYIKGVDRFGNVSFTTESISPYSPEHTLRVKDHLLSYLEDYRTGKGAIGIFSVPGGNLLRMIAPVQKLSSLNLLNNQQLLLFGNEAGKGIIQQLAFESGLPVTVKTIQNDSISMVAQMDAENFLISGNKGVYWYNERMNSITEFIMGLSNTRLACEPVNSRVYVGSGNHLKVYTFPDGIAQEDLTTPAPILEILLLYNK